MTKSTEEQIAAIERRMEQLRARKQRIVAPGERQGEEAQDAPAHLFVFN